MGTGDHQYGYVTTVDARELGIPVVELGKLSACGQIRHVAYGWTDPTTFPPTRCGQFFGAVARVGGDAHLTGDAVVRNLAPVIPCHVRVGTTRRVRADLLGWIKVVREQVDPVTSPATN